MNSGNLEGFSIHPYTVDPEDIRSDAARAYYWPYKNRSTLQVKLNTIVNRIFWLNKKEKGNLRSGSVEVHDKKHGKHIIPARKGINPAAGAVLSSAILELSGVGNPRSAVNFSNN